MHDTSRKSDFEQGTMELIVEQLEELVVTLFEEIRERPGVALAILAGAIGAIIGAGLAARAATRASSPPARIVRRRARNMAAAAELAALGIKLLQNPLVRGYIRAALERQLQKRVSF